MFFFVVVNFARKNNESELDQWGRLQVYRPKGLYRVGSPRSGDPQGQILSLKVSSFGKHVFATLLPRELRPDLATDGGRYSSKHAKKCIQIIEF